MSEKMDRRKLRTKNLLRKALLELIEEKGVDAITVSDITKRAGLNRGTFYLHYQDVSDLLEQNKSEVYGGLREIIVQLSFLELFNYASKDEPYPKITRIFDFCKFHSEFFKVILGPKGDPSFLEQISRFMQNQLSQKIPEWQPQQNKVIVPLGYLITFVISANMGILQHWFAMGLKETPTELALIITRIVSQGVIASAGLSPTTIPVQESGTGTYLN
ncbi:TetR/AcrR family transcriptional regulator [Paenibacillus glufosinatiresistens]|uniref:TetR/AcrR family transcriptional regulator n=1 Tax=Paenibacillus glufosinatiresistens TaxID=3070657 RepID=UPI00286E681A|nr:TetR/AcrR family transcriptional regulator [Paenibacillus sp. YX.27]